MSAIKVLSCEIQPRNQEDGESDYYNSPRCHFWFKGETVLDHLVNRYHEPHQIVRELLPDVLHQAGITIDPKDIEWSQKAGCGCGCSPGFILNGATHKDAQYFDLYLDLEINGV